jgi:hypothetical protein
MLTDLQDTVVARVERVETGLAGIAALLDRVEPAADRRRAGLASAYRRRIERPVLELQGVADDLRLPALADAYVNPPCRVADVDLTTRPSMEEHDWLAQPLSTDIQRYLVGRLTSTEAVDAPLLIYGQPGSSWRSRGRSIAPARPAASPMPGCCGRPRRSW